MSLMKSNQLPEKWIWTKLTDVAEIIMGSSPPSSCYNRERIGLPFYQGKKDFGPFSPTPRVWCSMPYRIAQQGDTLLSVRAPVGPTNYCEEKCGIGRGLSAIRPKNEVSPLFLFFYLKLIEKYIALMGTGSTFCAIKRSDIEKQYFPLAPVSEQERIVAKVKALFAENTITRESLDKIPDLLKKLRQSALAKAFTGKLTNSEPDDNSVRVIETGPREEIRIEPEEKRQKELNLPKLREGWVWVKFGDLIESMKNGLYKSSNFYGSGIPSLRMYNIEGGKIVWKKIREVILSEREISEYGLQENDILLNRINSRELVGKAAVIPKGLGKIVFEAMNIRIRVRKEFVIPKYISYFLLTRYARAQIEFTCKQTVGMATVSQKDIRSWFIPYPSLEEQERVVEKVDEILLLSDLVESAGKNVAARTYNIQQAILAKAFKGELVPQCLDEEPASQLLLRLQTSGKISNKPQAFKEPNVSSSLDQTFRKKGNFTSIGSILDAIGKEATIEEVFSLSGLDMSDFWDRLKIEIDSGMIKRIEKEQTILLRSNK